ncbi:2OG-Fe(II) oxygenase family protein [Ceratobasidium sp. AG-Ba]|nr:2OG-Fe(II) oxygenase family protein [Ceratobasidium sp. AG-Ba]
MDHLSGYQVGQHPVHYISHFITEDEEAVLLRKIAETPAGKWRNLSNRRRSLQGGELTKSGALIPQDLPAFVTSFPGIIDKLRTTGAFASTSQGTANHIILNEYRPGQGITPHEDGPAYHPVVATLSLGSHTIMDYYRYQNSSDATNGPGSSGKVIDPAPVLRLLLEPRSLVITHGSLYAEHLHGIAGVERDIIISKEHLPSATAEKPPRNDNSQMIFSQDIANTPLLGDPSLRARLALLESQGVPDCTIELERHTRTSLTCRVVERTASAVGRLMKLR